MKRTSCPVRPLPSSRSILRSRLVRLLICGGSAAASTGCETEAEREVGADIAALSVDVEPSAVTKALSTRQRQLIAAKIGAREQSLRLWHGVRLTLPLTGKRFNAFKAYDTERDRTEDVALDATDNFVDRRALLAEEQRARRAKFGAGTEALHQRLGEKRDQDSIRVMLKLNVPESLPDKTQFAADGPDDAQRQMLNQQRQATATTAAAKLAGLLQRVDAAGTRAESDGPFVFIDLPAAALKRAVFDSEVSFADTLDDAEVLDAPTISQSLPATKLDFLQFWGLRGNGVKIAPIETGVLNLPNTCFHLTDQQSTNASPADHVTRVVGIIGNRYGNGNCQASTYEGYAPDASIYHANAGTNSNYAMRWAWARDRGVNVATMSWHFAAEETDGALSARDVYFDYQVTQPPYPTVFMSAGNEAPSSYAIGKGYNSIGVGNIINDGDGNRCNDTMGSTSSYKNPTSPHSDRELPPLATVGSDHALLGTTLGGTSAATPATAGIAAVVMQANTALMKWPEAMRAILLATATYQKADGANWGLGSEGKDGTGLTNAKLAAEAGVLRWNGNAVYASHDYGLLTNTKFSNGAYTTTYQISVTKTNARVRVALAWDSKTTGSTSSVLDTDLDLRVFGPNGSAFASSSYDNSYEFVEFQPPVTGTYTVTIQGFTLPSNLSTFFGIAWIVHDEICP